MNSHIIKSSSPPPGCALGILLDFDHLSHLQFIISLSQHHKTATTTTTALSLQRHRHKLYCLRLAASGEQYNGSLLAVVGKVVPHSQECYRYKHEVETPP